MASNQEHVEYLLVTKEEMESFMIRCLTKVGSKKEHAEILAECLVTADYRGIFSHGLNKFGFYVRDVHEGVINFDDSPVILKDFGATALIDGKSQLGPVVGNFCMDLAIKKAKEFGIGMVVTRGSNHYGIAGYYSTQALKENLIGMSFTNTSPILFPTRAKELVLGSNPISFAAPGKENDSFVLDMATSTVAWGKVEVNHRKGLDIPPNWGADKNGKVTTNPSDVLNNGGLLPLGGVEETSGYKGYGLAFLVEILCGILSGSSYGPNIRHWRNAGFANLGQCFIAINPGNFEDGFNDRLQNLMDYCRNLEPADEENPVMVAGDPEKNHMNKCDKYEGIPYHPSQIDNANQLALKYGVDPVVIKGKINNV